MSSFSSAFFLRKRRLLRINIAMAAAAMTIIAQCPPKCIRNTRMPAPMNAAPAVINHPPITEMTPVIRNTALSRLQALSESDVPIATIKVTNVVDNGNFNDVPRAMSIPASIRFTDALMRSNAAPCSVIDSSLSKRRLSHNLILSGVTLFTQLISVSDHFTRRRAIRDEPNISSPVPRLLSPISVFDTLRAFFDVASDTTIIRPAPIRKYMGVLAGRFSDPIMNVFGSPAPLAT